MVEVGQLRQWNRTKKLFVVTSRVSYRCYIRSGTDGTVTQRDADTLSASSTKVSAIKPESSQLIKDNRYVLPLKVDGVVLWGNGIGKAILDIDSVGNLFMLFDKESDGNYSQELTTKHGKRYSFEWNNEGMDYVPDGAVSVVGAFSPEPENKHGYTAGGKAHRKGPTSAKGAFVNGEVYDVTVVGEKYMTVVGRNGRSYEYAVNTKSFEPVMRRTTYFTSDPHIGMMSKRCVNHMIQADSAAMMMAAYNMKHAEIAAMHKELSKTITGDKNNMSIYDKEKTVTDLKAARETIVKAVEALDADLDARVLQAFHTAQESGENKRVTCARAKAAEDAVRQYDVVLKQIELLKADEVQSNELSYDVINLIMSADNVEHYKQKITITPAG